jgi:hypothetical protein
MDERRLTKEIYEADLGGNDGRGRPRRTFIDQIGPVFRQGPGQKYPKPVSVYEEFDKVEEAKYACKDCSKWKEIISAYPNRKRA